MHFAAALDVSPQQVHQYLVAQAPIRLVLTEKPNRLVAVPPRIFLISGEQRQNRVTAEGHARKVTSAAIKTMIFLSKDSHAVTDYIIDWSASLAGDTIVSMAFIPPAPLTLIGSSTIDGSTTISRISGGVIGREYLLEFIVTGASGQVYAQSITLTIAN